MQPPRTVKTPEELEGYSELNSAQQKEIQQMFQAASTKSARGTSPSPKRKKMGGSEKEEFYESVISKLNTKSLKDILKLNNQPTEGVKDELVERVIDGMVNGAIPPCPKCKLGKLRVHESSGVVTYNCSGAFDANSKTFHRCNFSSSSLLRTFWRFPAEFRSQLQTPL